LVARHERVEHVTPGKPAIAPKLVTWFEDRSDALYLSSITAAEIEAGISKAHRTGPPRRTDELRTWFERMLSFLCRSGAPIRSYRSADCRGIERCG
jgi:hypothetical protein